MYQDSEITKDLLREWQWLVGNDMKIIHVLRSGDAILADNKGFIYRLVTGEGKYMKIADTLKEFDKKMLDHEFYKEQTLEPVVAKLQKEKPLKENQVYSFTTLPVLGGTYTVENMYPLSVEEHFSVTGDICFQIKDLKDGEKVQIKVTD